MNQLLCRNIDVIVEKVFFEVEFELVSWWYVTTIWNKRRAEAEILRTFYLIVGYFFHYACYLKKRSTGKLHTRLYVAYW